MSDLDPIVVISRLRDEWRANGYPKTYGLPTAELNAVEDYLHELARKNDSIMFGDDAGRLLLYNVGLYAKD